MKRVTVCLILILLSTSFVCAEVTRKVNVNPDGTAELVFYSEGTEIARQIKDKDGNIIKTIGKIPDGTVREFYEGRRLKSEWNYRNGKREKIGRQYYESGKLRYEVNFKDDKLEGVSKTYSENGKLMKEGNYKNGKLEGISKGYYESGELRYEWNHKNNKSEGISREYRKDGKLKKEVNYRNGEWVEKTTWGYHDNGNVLSEIYFKDGKKTGEAKWYHEDGKLRVIDTYEDGKTIDIKYYNKEGNLIVTASGIKKFIIIAITLILIIGTICAIIFGFLRRNKKGE